MLWFKFWCLFSLPCNAFLYARGRERAQQVVVFRSSSSSPSSASSDRSSCGGDDKEALVSRDLQEQAQALRDEIFQAEKSLNETKTERKTKAIADVDGWIEHVLVNYTAGNTQLLNTVDQAAQILKDERYSPEQVDKMFRRVCETCPIVGRDSLDRNALLALLIDAAGKLDQLEPCDNPNKRWNGRVERDLRKKLFAKEWNIDLESSSNSDYSVDEVVGRYKDG